MNGANKSFMKSPTDWLASNLIVYNVSQAGHGSDNPFGQQLGTIGTELPTEDFDLRKLGSIVNAGGKAKEYDLKQLDEAVNKKGKARKVSDNTHVIKAYFLPWGPGQTYSGKLGANASYFFTPTLNGCTFAYSGSASAPSVAHSNFVDANTITDQNAIDTDLAAKFGGAAPATTYVKTDYKRGGPKMDYRAMVVGVREGTDWSFYVQEYSVDLHKGGLVREGVNLCKQI